jgi:hypothetical protein
MQTLWMRLISAGIALWALAGCNSTTDGSSTTTTNASASGVWSGSDSVSGLTVAGIINSAGRAAFIRSDGVQFDGTVQVSGSNLAVTVDGYSNFPGDFSDGSDYGIGTLDGSVSTAGTLAATLTFTTNGSTSISGSWSLSYVSLSSSGSSLATVAANYTDSVTGVTVSITSAGVMTAQNGSNSCVLNGSISTGDSTTDVYEVAYSYEDCTGTYASLNGVQFTGLATLNTSTSPIQLTIAVTGTSSSGAKYGIVSTLNGS